MHLKVIKDCEECPFFEGGVESNYNHCDWEDRSFTEKEKYSWDDTIEWIPSWCPILTDSVTLTAVVVPPVPVEGR